ncbi:Engulfment and cell motility protein 3 [Bagarius yarrelli]|uniref:Engulfment and cell motility protein 3 n=1 Tax=Bagarius yarrelli TaxID=175774 RepID=A0A556V2M6_BAGYA|nr:Engulfment and cell motility protein 3 [Bagarius yarrelli]
MPQQKDIVKIAIQMPGAYPQLIQLDQNRLDIKNGSILRLTKAPGIQSSDSDVRCESLKQLATISTDITFAQEFISRDGHSLLVHIVEDANEAPLIMTHTLTAFMELMDHGIVSWENLSSIFIKKIAGSVNAKVMDTSIQQVSLDILESMTKAMALLMALLQTAGDADRHDLFAFLEKKNLRQYIHKTESDGSLSTERRRSLCAKEFKKLGFSCPFARSSIQLTLMLCEILRIGEPPSETGSNYHPIFFAQDRLLEELFCICIQLLNKTWKEMRATQEDFDKVMQVVREQITRTLSSKPTSLELFKNKVNTLNYSEILKLRQTERLHQEETLAPPVLELKERLKPELLELIRQQRLNRLCHGTLFRKISNRRRQDKLWYCRLSPNYKVLHYGDVEEETETPSIESLQDKIPVADIKALLTGKDCPHMKDNRNKHKEMLDLAFSITYDVEEYNLNFVASSRTDFCLWTDGLNILLGKEMSSESMRSELEILLSMEIKLRLLDLENVPIPDSAPPVPKPPSNFNFCYDFSQAEQ